ncbi:MAG: response regulator [Duganella sp.]
MKRLDTVQKFRKLFGVLVAAVAVIVLIILLGLVHVLNQSRLRYYAAAAETSRNLAITLEGFLQAHFTEVDLAMRRANAEFGAMHAANNYSDAAFSAFLRTLKERVPQAQAVRGSDASGRVIYGEGVDTAQPQDLGIREFFERVKTSRTLVFGVPVKSRISGQWVLPLVYPLTLPDGSFGGTGYVTINTAVLDESFAALKIGAHGSIVLLDAQKRVLHRYPQIGDMQIGSEIQVNPVTQSILDGVSRRGTYTVRSPRDGLERTLSVEKVGDYPVHVVVGLASQDFLAPWYHKELRNAGIFAVVLLLMAGALLMSVRVGLRKQFQSLLQLVETDHALQQSLARLTASDARWRSLTEGLPQMVWTARPDLRVDFLSHHWEEFSGMPAIEMMGDGNWSQVIHPQDMAALSAEWQRATAEGREFRCDARLRRHDGVWRVFDHHALAQRDADGALVSWVGSSTDRTEARAVHAALLQAKEEALKAGRAKTEFVANMSHEIRSPMNAVLGMLQLLQQTGMNERQQDYVAKAEAAARALLGLLNDILDFSKVEAGKLALDPHPFRLDKLWRDLAVILSANVGPRQIEVLFRIDPALPDVIVGDDLRLQQILLNLAGNAIKFTERGEVVVAARQVVRSNAGDGRLAINFSIRDTGIGISDEQRRRIFDGFSQAEASTARRYGGTGLGLAISQRLVGLMGGKLGVESEPGQGSVFDFTIDFATQAAPAGPDHAMRDLACLVVDDNPTARMVLGEMATSFGWRVDTASGGEEALALVADRIARQRAYDVVFIDWRMPGLDGWETSCRIRQLPAGGKLPLIVMVTAHDREMLAQRQQQLSTVLDGFVVKPVTASMLYDAVADARLEGRAPAAAVPAPAGARLRGVRLLLVDDNPANQQVASELLGNDGARVQVASSGLLAIQALADHAPLPDLILMDIQMPDMDGYETTQAILRQLGDAAPPIVAMTANAMAADRTAALNAGMVDHIGKPFDLAQLIDVILRHVDGAAAQPGDVAAGPAAIAAIAPIAPIAAIAPIAPITPIASITPTAAMDAMPVTAIDDAAPAPADASAPAALPGPGIDEQAALKRMGGMTSIYLMALRSFEVEVVRLAQQIDAARASHDAAAVLTPLHTLKGLAGTIGAERLQELARRAEAGFRQGPDGAAWALLAPVDEAMLQSGADVAALVARLAPGKSAS